MGFRGDSGCFELPVEARWAVLTPRPEEVGAWPRVRINGIAVSGVTSLTAEMDGRREWIGAAGQSAPVGITSPKGGWILRMEQTIPPGQAPDGIHSDHFLLDVLENGRRTSYQGCCWNRVSTLREGTGTRVTWEGMALRREEETVDVQNAV